VVAPHGLEVSVDEGDDFISPSGVNVIATKLYPSAFLTGSSVLFGDYFSFLTLLISANRDLREGDDEQENSQKSKQMPQRCKNHPLAVLMTCAVS
jgi:hypothetical protein